MVLKHDHYDGITVDLLIAQRLHLFNLFFFIEKNKLQHLLRGCANVGFVVGGCHWNCGSPAALHQPLPCTLGGVVAHS